MQPLQHGPLIRLARADDRSTGRALLVAALLVISSLHSLQVHIKTCWVPFATCWISGGLAAWHCGQRVGKRAIGRSGIRTLTM